ncbi:hypothetical protein J4440_02075 [Candidatus Woesearchaeota archaeon]|nr:hypothetical protein [Candidatus Woesearchaeota archaeon]
MTIAKSLKDYIEFIETGLKNDPFCLNNRSIVVPGATMKDYQRPTANMLLHLQIPFDEAQSFVSSLGYKFDEKKFNWCLRGVDKKYGFAYGVTRNSCYIGDFGFEENHRLFTLALLKRSDNEFVFWGENGCQEFLFPGFGASLLLIPKILITDEQKNQILKNADLNKKILLKSYEQEMTIQDYFRNIRNTNADFFFRSYVEENLYILRALYKNKIPIIYHQPNTPTLHAVQGENLEKLISG